MPTFQVGEQEFELKHLPACEIDGFISGCKPVIWYLLTVQERVPTDSELMVMAHYGMEIMPDLISTMTNYIVLPEYVRHHAPLKQSVDNLVKQLEFDGLMERAILAVKGPLAYMMPGEA